MDTSAINKVCRSVGSQFPEFRNIKPSVRSSGSQNLLIFSTKVKTADGKTLPRTLRVTADEQGSIIKLSTSR